MRVNVGWRGARTWENEALSELWECCGAASLRFFFFFFLNWSIQSVGEQHIPINLAVGITSSRLMAYYFLSRCCRTIVWPQCEVTHTQLTADNDNARCCLPFFFFFVFFLVLSIHCRKGATAGMLMQLMELILLSDISKLQQCLNESPRISSVDPMMNKAEHI